MRSVEGRYGKIWFYGKDKYIGRGLHAYGEFSYTELQHILELAKLGNGLCLDIGANMGCVSQMLSVNNMKVVAFEPQPELVKCLERNFTGEINQFALGSREYKEIMPKYDYSSNGSFGQASLGTSSYLGSIEVDVKTLDSLTFDRVGFIKIDVEGHELEVLKGARNTILRDRPYMYIEDDRHEKSASLYDYLDELEYTYEMDTTPLFNPNNFFGNKINIWGIELVSLNLICKPKC